MTNTQLELIWKANIDLSRLSAMRAIYNAGWYEGAAVTPTTTSPDKSCAVAAPAAIIRQRHVVD